MKEIKTVDAVGHIICHDITQIVRGVDKGVKFKKGHVVREEDVEVLLNLGKAHLYVWEKGESMLHEDEAAEILRDICIGKNMRAAEPKEGKIDIFADADGLLEVDIERLRAVNSLEDIMIATRYSGEPIRKGEKLAGTRVIPLVIEKEKLEEAKKVAGDTPLLKLIPFRKLKAGIITTGSEVATGRIKDTFTPVLIDKLANYGAEVVAHVVVGDDKEDITNNILKMKADGADLILCSGGMSVDPDDRTPGAIKDSGVRIVSYGAPVLPGAMFLLGYFDDVVPVAGLPGCVMYSSTTIFDLILPRLIAGVEVSKKDLAGLGHGGLCLNCEVCTWPTCGFGKGV